MVPFRKLRHSLELPAARLLVGCASIIPQKLSWLLAGAVGDLAADLPGRSAEIFDINRRHVAEPCGMDVTLGNVYRNLISGMMDFIRLQRIDDARFGEIVEVRGERNMASALAGGRGVLAITAHYSAWELIPRAVGLHGHKVGVVSRRLSHIATSEYLDALRQRHGVALIDRGAGLPRLMRCLRENTAVGILIDQDTLGVESDFVDFLGLPARTPVGPARLALRFGIPVIPLHIRRTGGAGAGYVLEIEEPVDLSGFQGADGYLGLTAHLTGRIGDWIRDDPEQWVWIHERWARRPGSAPGLR